MLQRTILAALVMLCTTAAALAQPLADRVPADAMFYIGWCGSDSLPPQYEQSHLKAVVDNSKIRELFSQFLPQLGDLLVKHERDAAEPVALVKAMGATIWKHPSAYFFAGMDMTNPQQPMPKAGVICKTGADTAAVQKQVMEALAKAGPTPVQVFGTDDTVVVCVGYQMPPQAMADAATSLKQSAKFTAAMKQVQANPVMAAYFDVEAIVAMVEGIMQQQAPPDALAKARVLIDSLGIRGLRRVICTSGFDGKDWMSQSFIDAPAPRTGLMEMLDAKPVSSELLKTIPGDATFMATARFDAAKFLTRLRDSVGQVDPQAQVVVNQVLGAVQLAMAKNPITDVLEPLGDDWAIYCSPSVGGNGVMGMVAVNRPDDMAKAQASLPTAWYNLSNWVTVALNRADTKVQIAGRVMEIDGQKVYYVGAPIIAPSWTLRDGFLYMGFYPQTAGTAARWAAGKEKSITQNPKYAALQKRLGVKDACSVSFYDLPTTAAHGTSYQTMLTIARYAGFADLWGVPLPEPLVPPMDVLQKHVDIAGSAGWVDDVGYHVKAIAPFPGAKMLSEPGMVSAAGPATSALMISIMLPALNRSRETANRVKCASNMKQIGQAILLYSNEQKGAYPPNLGELLRTQGITAEVFVCPSAHGHDHIPRGDAAVAWVDANADYIYVGAGMKNSAPADQIVLYEKPGNHEAQGMNMLFADGHVEFRSMQQAMQLIEQQGAGR